MTPVVVNTLVIENVDWADGCVTWYARMRNIPRHDWDDLVQIGRIGLMEAAQRYKPKLGKFRTYAWDRVVGAVKDYLRVTFGRHEQYQPKSRSRIKYRDYVSYDDYILEKDIRFSVNGTEKQVANQDLVQKILVGISPKSSMVLRKYFLEGETLVEIGEQLPKVVGEARVSQLKGMALEEGRRFLTEEIKWEEI